VSTRKRNALEAFRAQAEEAIQPREAVPGVPGDGPYPATVEEVATELTGFIAELDTTVVRGLTAELARKLFHGTAAEWGVTRNEQFITFAGNPVAMGDTPARAKEMAALLNAQGLGRNLERERFNERLDDVRVEFERRLSIADRRAERSVGISRILIGDFKSGDVIRVGCYDFRITGYDPITDVYGLTEVTT
jgi:hypothetical protein